MNWDVLWGRPRPGRGCIAIDGWMDVPSLHATYIFSLCEKALDYCVGPRMIMTFWWRENHQQFCLESNTDRSSSYHVTLLVLPEICARFCFAHIQRTNVLTLPLVNQVNQLIFFILHMDQHMHTNYKLTISIAFLHVSAINRHAQEDISYLLLNMYWVDV